MREYHVVPFDPGISERDASKKGAETVADRLQQTINHHSKHGWEYDRYDSVVTTVNPGCLSFFQGPQRVYYGVIVFSRAIES